MKKLILGDIHGRTCWKDIIIKENPDQVIFLGDYVTTHEFGINSEMQVQNVLDIMQYKKDNPQTIILWGNHDCQHAGYDWAEMSGWDYHLYHGLLTINFKDWMLENAQFAYIDNNVIYSHAGISNYWLKEVMFLENPKDVVDMYPNPNLGYNYILGYGEGCGNSRSQSPIWIRPESLLLELPKGYNQVVGHTPVKHIINIESKIENQTENLWLCDALPKEYLVNIDEKFQVKLL